MKSFLFFLLMLISFNITAQTGWVYSISKDGKKAHKECIDLSVSPEKVLFVVNGTTYQLFYSAGSDGNGKPIWADGANNKIVSRQVEADGTVVFWKSEKKAFYYKD